MVDNLKNFIQNISCYRFSEVNSQKQFEPASLEILGKKNPL